MAAEEVAACSSGERPFSAILLRAPQHRRPVHKRRDTEE